MKTLLCCLLFLPSMVLHAEDVRDGALRTLNDYFPFKPVADAAAWQTRSEQLRVRTKVALGLWPEPEKTPLKAVVHGKVDRPEYTVERVYFQSLPGHFVTGSLYRPKQVSGKSPGVLCPHGHWNNGRFHSHGEAHTAKEIESGGEKFPMGGRHPLQSRCVQLARMGCTVFHYDMIGYADSVQFSEHRPGVREHMNTLENWGMFSPQAELRLQGLMHLQTWNSVRAVDFLLSLPHVDPDRIGVTGASGGATQTMMLMAADDRPDIAFPAVMVSTGMQGGCPCENANYLRIDSGNIDIAALCAPRPLAISGADDWTVEIMTKGWPDLQNVYGLIGKPDHVHAAAFTQYKHNFNAVSRQVMYEWFNTCWKLTDQPMVEREYEPLTREELTVWSEAHPTPAGGEEHERAVMKWFADQKIEAETWEQFNSIYRPAWEVLIGRALDEVESVERKGEVLRNNFGEEVRIRESLADGDAKGVVIYLGGIPFAPPIEYHAIHSLLYKPNGKNRLESYGNGKNPWQQFAGYTYGYNHSLFAQRVHDLLTIIAYAKSLEAKEIHLVGVNGWAHIAAAARVAAGDAVTTLTLSPGDFDFGKINAFDQPDFVPGSVKYGGLPALVALNADQPTTVLGPLDVSFPIPADAKLIFRASGDDPYGDLLP